MSLAPRPKEMRRASRQDVCYRCAIAGMDTAPVNALLVNVSPFGCMIRCSHPVQIDTQVSFALPVAGRIQGRVVWAIGGRIGMEFSQAIDADPYLEMLHQLNRPGDEMGVY